jgi:ABC-type branched-subunit amino acid transport system ATPase component
VSEPQARSILSLRGIQHRYDGVLALANVNLDVAAGEFLAIFGPNGAGKSSLALIMSGILRATHGQIKVDDSDAGSRAGGRGLVDLGVTLIPEGRRLFGQLSVEENLILGAYGVGVARQETRRRLERVYAHMPQAIRDGRDRSVVTLSGGEQQMLAIGRALMAAPRVILIDEPSLGLAPILTERVYELLSELQRNGATIVVFEQLAVTAMEHAKRVVIIDRGEIYYEGQVAEEATQAALRAGYLGEAG